jgi:hypothetical protein
LSRSVPVKSDIPFAFKSWKVKSNSISGNFSLASSLAEAYGYNAFMTTCISVCTIMGF